MEKGDRMTDREKLMNLVDFMTNKSYSIIVVESMADYLIDNGVMLVKKGKWLDGHCANCGSRELGLFDAKNYCPNCGAKME